MNGMNRLPTAQRARELLLFVRPICLIGVSIKMIRGTSVSIVRLKLVMINFT